MATIRPRRRRDGKLAYQTEVRIKRNGPLVHRESKTFDQRRIAAEWATRREDQLSAYSGDSDQRYWFYSITRFS